MRGEKTGRLPAVDFRAADQRAERMAQKHEHGGGLLQDRKLVRDKSGIYPERMAGA